MIEGITLSDPIHRQYLEEFIQQSKNLSTFRYYQTREMNQALKAHILTLLDIENGKVRGYAHIDYDENHKRHFIGICVLPLYQKKGIGSSLMTRIIQVAEEKKIHLYLSVDKENTVARNLYTKFGFRLCEQRERFDFFERPISST